MSPGCFSYFDYFRTCASAARISPLAEAAGLAGSIGLLSFLPCLSNLLRDSAGAGFSSTLGGSGVATGAAATGGGGGGADWTGAGSAGIAESRREAMGTI